MLVNFPTGISVTKTLSLHGYKESVEWTDPFFVYGSDASLVKALAKENRCLERNTGSEVAIYWMLKSSGQPDTKWQGHVEDVLARRTRALFLDARAAIDMAPAVAHLMADELKKDEIGKRNKCYLSFRLLKIIWQMVNRIWDMVYGKWSVVNN